MGTPQTKEEPVEIPPLPAEQLQALSAYTACDIADALLKLGVKGAGFLPDLKPILAVPRPPHPKQALNPSNLPTLPTLPTTEALLAAATAGPQAASRKIIAPISTALFLAKNTPSFPESAPPIAAISQTLSAPFSNIPQGTPYSDLARPGTVLLLSQPQGQACAVLGGIMAARLKTLGVRAVLVDGRVRDLGTLRDLAEGRLGGSEEMPIWSRGTSIVGAGAETKPWCVDVEVSVGGCAVAPGDVAIIDEEEGGVVVIPRAQLETALGLLPRMVEADERVMEDVLAGGEVGEAFAKYRGK